MKNYSHLSEDELYRRAYSLMCAEAQTGRANPLNERLFEYIESRNPRILPAAVEDADRDIQRTREQEFWTRQYGGIIPPAAVETVRGLRRIDFCTKQELQAAISALTKQSDEGAAHSIHEIIKALHDGYFLAAVVGESMKGLSKIEADDVVIIRETTSAKDGTVVLVEVGGRTLIKRLRYRNTVELHSDNPRYGVMQLDESHSWKLLGKVTHIVREVFHDVTMDY